MLANPLFQFPVRVYYEDTDAGGVVYHARYLHFFERARTEYLRTLDFSQQALLNERNLAFVVKPKPEYHSRIISASSLDNKSFSTPKAKLTNF